MILVFFMPLYIIHIFKLFWYNNAKCNDNNKYEDSTGRQLLANHL